MHTQKKLLSSGFTLVELLIVIVIIAILASITIVSYNGITGRANDAVIQSDLDSLAKKTQIYHAENGVYPTVTDLPSLEFRASTSSYDTSYYNLYYCAPSDRSDFIFGARSKSGTVFYASASKGKGSIAGASAISYANVCGVIDADPAGGYRATGYSYASSTWNAWAQ